MQKTTTLKDFKVFVLKTILAIFVLSISFLGSSAQDVQSRPGKGKATFLAKPAQIDASSVKSTVVQNASAQTQQTAVRSAAALKQQMRAAGADRTGARVNTNNPAKAQQTQNDVSGNVSASTSKVTPSPNNPTVACLFNGTITAGDPTMANRLFRPGTAGGTCAAPQPFPGLSAQTVGYDTYTFTNTTGAAACVTANLTTTDPAPNIMHGAWLGSFNPANLAANYIADPYSSTITPGAPGVTFSFNLANGATVVFAVWSLTPTNSGYTLSIDGLPNLCPQPTCVPSTGAVISAVSMPITEGFDGVIPTAGWPIQNLSNPIGAITWNQGSANGVFPSHSGAGYASVNFNSGGGLATISNWMFSPATTLHNGDQFKFWTSASAGGGIFPDRLQVRMSTNGTSTNVGSTETSTGDFGTLLLDINPTYSTTGYPEVWTQYSVTVSGVPAAGIQGRMAFRYFVENGGPAGANSNYIGIDDVQYVASGTPTVCSGGSGFVKVDITGGSSPFTLVLNANPPGGVPGNFTVSNYTSGTLIPVGPITATTSYTIVSVTASGSGGSCTGTGNTGVATIGLTPASTAAVLSQVQVAGPPVNLFNEGFDGTIPPAGWSIQNLSSPIGVVTWNQGSGNGVFPSHAGAGYASVNFNSGGGVATISNWMFAPSVLLKNGDKFTFWTRASTGGGIFPDRLQVRLNTTNTGTNVGATATSVGDYTTLLIDINPTYSTTGYPEAWTQYTATMSGLPAAGVSGRIAFRYFVENGGPAGANSNYIGIDDAVYTTQTLINPTTCTGSTANLKVDITGGTSPYTVVINRTPGGLLPPITGYVSGTNIPVTPPVTTTYNLVSVTSAEGCLGTGNSGTPTITVSPTVVGAIQIVDDPTGPLCAGNPKLLTVTGAGGPTPFTNPTLITINSSVPATPSPSVITVAGLPTTGVSVTNVIINGFSHTWTGDVNIVLQHSGTNVMLKGDSQADPSGATTNATWTFSDAAAASLPAGAAPTGTYLPTNRNGSPFAFLAPGPTVTGPTFPASPTLATFTGDMNGAWNLYVEDRVAGDQGTITGGYTIIFNVPSSPPVGYTWSWSPAAGLSSTTTNPVAASPMSTTTYTVMGTAPSGCQTTAQITVTVLPLPAVVTNPTNVTACGGSSVTFTGSGTGAGVTYQWQVSTNGGGTWNNIPAGAPYSGETTTTLTINPVTVAMNGYRYRLGVSGTCPPTAYSTGAILTVIAQPNVTVSPTGTVCGGFAGINGTALTASGANTYTWSPAAGLYTNANGTGAYIAGSNVNPVYAAPTVYTTYTVTGTNTTTGCTNTATVNVNATPPPPTVTPNPVSMCLGDAPVRLISSSSTPGTCTVSSGTISVPVPDNTANGAISTLNVNCVPAGATITSMSVTINMPHTWDGDMIFNLKAPNNTILNLAKYLTGTGGAGATTGFTNTQLSSAAGNALSGGTNPYTGTFKADLINGPVAGPTVQNPAGYVSTAAAWSELYSVPNGTWTLAMADGGLGDVGTLTSWSITINYIIGVQTTPATWSPNFGLFNNNAGVPGTPYTGTPADTVWAQPTPAGVYNYNVTVQSLPPAPVTVTTPMAGGNGNSMVLFNLKNNNAITYTLKSISTNVFTSGTEATVRLWYNTTAISGQPLAITPANGWNIAPGGTANNVVCTANTLNQVLTNITLAIPAGATYGIGLEFTDGITFPAYTNGTGTLQTYSNNGVDLITDGNVGWGGFPSPAVPANNPRNFNGAVSLVASLAPCTSSPRVVTVTVNTPVTVTTQPVNRTICTDGTTTFTVAATGSNISYQWQVSTNNGSTWTNISNGGVYSGATTNTLTITAPPVSLSGNLYRALVSGAAPCPAVPSFNALLTVNPLPTIVISASPLTALFPGLTTTLSSTVSPVAGANFTWLRNGLGVAGATTGTLVVDVDGLGEYQLRVTDINGCTNVSNKITIRDSVSTNCFLYPNPSNGKFQVRYYSVQGNVLPRTVTVYNSTGTRVLTQTFTVTAPYARMDLDLRAMGHGVYWVEIGDLNGSRIAMCRAVVQ